MNSSRQKVITWKAPTSGREVRICPECEGRLRTKGTWPRDDRGEELCQVSRGLARGECDLCSPDAGE